MIMSDETTVNTEVQTEESASTDTLLTDTNSTVDDTVENTSEEVSNDTEVSGDTDEGSQTTPEAYADFVMPEGVELDSAILEGALPILKEMGATQEQAQKLADIMAGQVQASSQGQADAFSQLMNDWVDQSKNDKEFGGDKFEESIATARHAIDAFGTPELKQLLEEHGVGNHPEVIRFMVKVGKLTAEDVPGGNATPSNAKRDMVSRMYPSDT